MHKPRVLVDGRIFSLQAKGGISQQWSYVLGSRAWGEAIDTTLLVYPGHDKNLHLRELGLVGPGRRVLECPIPPSDNVNFQGEAQARQRAELLRAAGAADVEAVLNTYYGECVLPGAPRYLVTALDFAHEELADLAAMPSTPNVLKMKALAFAQATEACFISSASRRRFFVHYPAFPQAATRVIHLGHAATDPQVHKVSGLIVHVGTRGLYKNFAVAARALERVLAAQRGARLLVVGGEQADPASSALMARFPGRVCFVPQLGDAEVDLAVAMAHVYLSPSRYEGFGLPLLNALRLGAVPAISDIPVYRELAGDDAEFFDPLEPSGIEAALLRALKRPAPLDRRYSRTWEDVARDYVRWLAPAQPASAPRVAEAVA